MPSKLYVIQPICLVDTHASVGVANLVYIRHILLQYFVTYLH